MRIKGNGIYYHVICRCNNGERLLAGDTECVRILKQLKRYSNKYNTHIHNYAIMPSHVHIMLMTNDDNHIDVFMHDFCLAVAASYNQRHQRGGHFWRHRYRCKVLDDDRYALACLRYLDRNPVHAGLANSPGKWRWSGYRYYAFGEENTIITPHPSYHTLGQSLEQKRESYRMMVEDESIDEEVEKYLFEGKCQPDSKRYKLMFMHMNNVMSRFMDKRQPSVA